jgi:hypothetical protein
MRLRSGKLPFLGSEDEFFYHTGFDKAIAQLCTVNGIGPEEAKELFKAEMAIWRKRSKKQMGPTRSD